MSAAPERDLISRSRDFRRDMLTPSGGWLHDIVVGASTVTGLSDYFLLGVIFVGSWCILRLAEREIALILGLGFDLTIPLQHSLTANARVKERHQHHMEQYWPVFFVGMAIEIACLLFVHPTMFTLVVCLKTTVCTAMWFVQGPSAAAAAAPTTKVKTTKPASNAPASNAPPSDAPPGGGEAPSGTGKRSAKEKQITDMANELRANGYKSATLCKVIADGIISQKGATPEKVKASFEKRRDATPEKKEEYEKQAKEYKENRDKRRKEGEQSQQTPQT